MIQPKEQDGRRIGKYLVVEKIGEGGFGKVYRAIDPELDRTVAIKTLTSSDNSYRLRFQREAKFIARLDHERIVRVYNSGIDGEEPYLVEEMLSGEDLKETIAHVTRLPTLNSCPAKSRVGAESPIEQISPTISCPKIVGNGTSRRPSNECKSLPHNVQPSTRTRISLPLGCGNVSRRSSSSRPAPWKIAANEVVMRLLPLSARPMFGISKRCE